jgi:hypothetical protein
MAMRPIRGVVIRDGSVLAARLESGLIIGLEEPGFEIGDKLDVFYNFEERKVAKIIKRVENAEVVEDDTVEILPFCTKETPEARIVK